MQFPETNKIHKNPVPESVESNAKKLEQYLNQVHWSVFGKAYLYLLGYALLTVFAFIVVVGVAKWLISLL